MFQHRIENRQQLPLAGGGKNKEFRFLNFSFEI
jgi:hypothetical protein